MRTNGIDVPVQPLQPGLACVFFYDHFLNNSLLILFVVLSVCMHHDDRFEQTLFKHPPNTLSLH